MSNELNQKVISIKKLTDIQKNQKDYHELAIGEQQALLKLEVEQSEQRLLELKTQKETMMDNLKQAIDKEKSAWLETKEQERQEAKHIGYKIGYDEGLEKAEQDWIDKLSEANHIVESANQDYYRTIEKHQEAILQLSVASAEKIIKDKLVENEGYFLSIIKNAIEDLKDRSNIVIYVHPSHYTFVLKQKEELEQLIEEGDLLSIYTDKQLGQEDCIIKHPFGQIEAGIDLQLQQIKNVLAEKIAEES